MNRNHVALIIIVVVVALALFLTACGDKSDRVTTRPWTPAPCPEGKARNPDGTGVCRPVDLVPGPLVDDPVEGERG